MAYGVSNRELARSTADAPNVRRTNGGSMVSADELRDLRSAASDWEGAEGLKSGLARLRAERSPFYLTAAELEPVFHWKLIAQYGRGRRHRDTNSDAAYRIATTAAFSVDEPDDDRDLPRL